MDENNVTDCSNNDSELSQSPAKNQFMDDITLQFLMNKTQYSKYLSSHDVEKNDEQEEFLSKIRQNKSTIIDISLDYINHPRSHVSTDLDEAFNHYIKACLKHLEMKEVERSNEGYYADDDKGKHDDEDEENMMFGTTPFRSFWGNGAIKK
jgi:hypothetical protein